MARVYALLLGLALSIGLLGLLEGLFRIDAVRALVPAPAGRAGDWDPPDLAATRALTDELDLSVLDDIPYERPRGAETLRRSDLDYSRKTPPGYRSGKHGLTPSRTTRSIVTVAEGGAVLYDVEYGVDGYARRRSSASPTPPRFNVVVFGGSFAYGEGVDDDQTLPSQLARLLPGAWAVNLGFHGEGPNDTLRGLEQPERLRNQGVPRRPGIAVFVFIDHHMDRVFPRVSVIRGRPGVLRRPAYVVEDGRARYAGTFYAHAPLTSLALLAISRSALALHLGIDFPPTWQGRHYELVARIIEEVQRASHERFGTGTLYLVTWPEASNRHGAAVIGKLVSADVVPVDLHRVPIRSLTGSRAFHPGDGHPTALAHALVAQLVARAVRDDPALVTPRTPPPSGGR